MIFKEKVKKYNLLMVIKLELKFYVIKLHQHKMQPNCNLVIYGIIYYVHRVVHIQWLNMILYERIINYAEVLIDNNIVQLLHITTTNFDLVLEKKKGKKKK